MSSNRHLRIFSDETGDVQQAELSVNSTRHRTAELPIDLGLRVHETPEGKDFLVMFAIKFIKAREKKKKRHTYGDRSFDEMPQWIDYFLTILRRDFPHVYLRKMEGEGMVVRYNWGDSMTSYDPTVAAELSLNRTIINNMIYAKEHNSIRNYNRFMFQMGLTAGHEIVHIFSGFLTGANRPNTPPEISLFSYRNMSTGEAGRYWDSESLGGVVEFYEDRKDPLGNKQAGIPYLFGDGHRNSEGRRISDNYIDEFVSRNFSFPIRTTGESITRSELRKIMKETSTLRKGRNATKYTSPTASTSSLAGGGPADMSRDRESENYWTWHDEYNQYYYVNEDGTWNWEGAEQATDYTNRNVW